MIVACKLPMCHRGSLTDQSHSHSSGNSESRSRGSLAIIDKPTKKKTCLSALQLTFAMFSNEMCSSLLRRSICIANSDKRKRFAIFLVILLCFCHDKNLKGLVWTKIKNKVDEMVLFIHIYIYLYLSRRQKHVTYKLSCSHKKDVL